MKRFLAWIFSFFGLLRKPSDNFYCPNERTLYHYWDGEKVIKQDPLVLYKRLMAEGPELSVNIKVSNTSLKGNIEASDEAARQIRSIFSIKLFSEGGLTESELTSLLGHFLNYCEGVKKNSPTIAMSAATPENIEPSSVENQPIPSTSPSNSIEENTSTVKHTLSPSASESPSVPSNPALIILGPTQMEKAKHSTSKHNSPC